MSGRIASHKENKMYRPGLAHAARNNGPAAPSEQDGPTLLGPPPNFVHLTQAVQQGLDEFRGEGSKQAYDKKRLEYREFCDSLYASSQFKYFVNDEKVFYFMFYAAMREQKKRGGRASRQNADNFDRADYEAVLLRYSVWWDNAQPDDDLPHPQRPIGIQAMRQYKAAVKAEWDDQLASSRNSLPWDLIWTQRCKKIFENVKKRKSATLRKQFAEKVSHEFSPYLAVERFPEIETYMWERGDGGQRFAFSWLRHRMCLLFTTSAILRCESLFKAELSDLLCIRYKAPKDVHTMHAVVMQMMTGKSLSVFFVL
jgi:hypothetical protein